jgi:hypothetical protein
MRDWAAHRSISQNAVSGPLMKKYDTVTDLSNDFRERRFTE